MIFSPPLMPFSFFFLCGFQVCGSSLLSSSFLRRGRIKHTRSSETFGQPALWKPLVRQTKAIKPAVALSLINQSSVCQNGRCTCERESPCQPRALKRKLSQCGFFGKIMKGMPRAGSQPSASPSGPQTQRPWAGNHSSVLAGKSQMGNLSPREAMGSLLPPLLRVGAWSLLEPESPAGSTPTSKEEEGPCEQEERGGSEEEAQKPCHPPKHHQDQAERQQNHKGPMHG